jgi:CheY-like chemotaxis protein
MYGMEQKLPRWHVSRIGHYPEDMNMDQCSSRRPHALIVEDKVMIALGLQADLEALGFEVTGLAANARQAMSQAMNDKPDLVVMDIYLNGARDGIEAARSIRRLLEHRLFLSPPTPTTMG